MSVAAEARADIGPKSTMKTLKLGCQKMLVERVKWIQDETAKNMTGYKK